MKYTCKSFRCEPQEVTADNSEMAARDYAADNRIDIAVVEVLPEMIGQGFSGQITYVYKVALKHTPTYIVEFVSREVAE